MAGQCPTCGRCDADWAAQQSKLLGNGKKVAQLATTEDRLAPFAAWRRQFGGGLYCGDLDLVEWRLIDGEVTFVAVMEMTRVDGSRPVPQSYLDAVLARMTIRDPQGQVARTAAALMQSLAFIVVWRWDCSEFWIYCLSHHRGWWHVNGAKYRAWIARLGSGDRLRGRGVDASADGDLRPRVRRAVETSA
jgi:hypothetical protein